MFYPYVLTSRKDGRWYAGFTSDLRKRFKDHHEGSVFSTKGRGPLDLIYYECCQNEGDARAREECLKAGPGKKYLKNRLKRFLSLTGFTLIEMLVILGVLSLLTTTLIFYSRTGERQILLFKEQARVFGLMTRAKSLALGTYGDPEVPCGYGIHFDAPRTMIVFKDLASDCDASAHEYTGTIERIEEITLDSRVYFDDLRVSDILFVPPDPKIFIVPDAPLASITIKTAGGESEATIELTAAGQISTR